MFGVVSKSKVVMAVVSTMTGIMAETPFTMVWVFVSVEESSSFIAVVAVVTISMFSVVGSEIAVVPAMVSNIMTKFSVIHMSPSEVVVVVTPVSVMLITPVSIVSPVAFMTTPVIVVVAPVSVVLITPVSIVSPVVIMGSMISVVSPAPVAMVVIVVTPVPVVLSVVWGIVVSPPFVMLITSDNSNV